MTTADATTPPTPDERPLAVFEPPTGWRMVDVRELWRFRELIFFLTWRDVKVRYKQTLLGVAWAVLQPAMMMVVFSLFLGRMANVSSGGMPYPVFVYAGLLPWTFFATAVSNSGNSVVSSERLVTKVYFPRLAIPFASVGAAGVDFVVALGLLGALMAWYHVAPRVGLLLAPLFMAAIALTALGVGTLVAALNVSYRDFRYVLPFMVQFWMFATPSVYMQPSDRAEPGLRALLALNPMTNLIAAFRAAVLGGPIHWPQVALSSACGVVTFVVGCLYFRKMEAGFADCI